MNKFLPPLVLVCGLSLLLAAPPTVPTFTGNVSVPATNADGIMQVFGRYRNGTDGERYYLGIMDLTGNGNPGLMGNTWINLDAGHHAQAIPVKSGLLGLDCDVPYGAVVYSGTYPFASYPTLDWVSNVHLTNQYFTQGWPLVQMDNGIYGYGAKLTLANLWSDNLLPVQAWDALSTTSYGTNAIATRYGALPLPGSFQLGVVGNPQMDPESTFDKTQFKQHFTNLLTLKPNGALVANGARVTTEPYPLNNAQLECWYRAVDISGLSDNAALPGVGDTAQQGVTLWPVSGQNAPTYKLNQLNGYPVFNFAQASHQIVAATNMVLNQYDSAVTMFAVFKPTANNYAGGTAYAIVGCNGGGTAELVMYNSVMVLLKSGVAGLGTGWTNVAANAWHIAIVTYDATGTYRYYLDGQNDGYGSALDGSSKPYVFRNDYRYPALGGSWETDPGDPPSNPPSYTAWFDGQIAEAGRFGVALSRNEVNQLFRYLSAKYNLACTSDYPGLSLPYYTKATRPTPDRPGVMIFQTDNTPGLRVWNGTAWVRFTETSD